MNIIVVGKEKEIIIPELEKNDFSLVEKNPDFVVSFGGDGTLMHAEHLYPGIPKILLKHSLICKKCSPLTNEEIIESVGKGNYAIENLITLQTKVDGKVITGINDIVVRNHNHRHAMRYRLTVNGKTIPHEIIGDGIVVATPFGSTAYYRSITDSFFETGIGLAFNNSTERFDHMILDVASTITLEVTRGPAIIYADNQEESVVLETGSVVTIAKGERVAQIVIPRAV